MGGPKALMRVGGQGWWEIQEERLERAGATRIWVVSPEVRRAMSRCASRMVDGDPAAPMFQSVKAGIAAAGDSVFVLPVDVPACGRETLEALAAAAEDRVTVPTFGGKRGHPVGLSAVWIRRVLSPLFRGECLRPEVSLEKLRLDQLIAADEREVAVDDPAVVVNLNTPEDLARWPG